MFMLAMAYKVHTWAALGALALVLTLPDSQTPALSARGFFRRLNRGSEKQVAEAALP